MQGITALTIDDFGSALRRGTGQAVIYFSASWCQPCQDMESVFAELARQTTDPDITFGAVDMARSPTIAQTYGIRSVPSIAVFRQGKLVDVIAGQAPIDEVRGRVRRAFADEHAIIGTSAGNSSSALKKE